jgi:uncharacterized protein YkwD
MDRIYCLVGIHLALSFLPVSGALAQPGGADLARTTLQIRTGTNDFRSSQGAARLATDPRLIAAAQEFADFMARTSKYGHDADGRTPAQRAKAKGYDHCMVAENIAYQYGNEVITPEELARIFMDGWKNSPGHRKNMLDTDARQFGVGVAHGKDRRNYAVQLFARPASEMTNFELRNASRATVSYRVGDNPYTLTPNTSRTHGICRALKLSIPGNEAVVPQDGDHFTIQGDARSLTLRRGG